MLSTTCRYGRSGKDKTSISPFLRNKFRAFSEDDELERLRSLTPQSPLTDSNNQDPSLLTNSISKYYEQDF